MAGVRGTEDSRTVQQYDRVTVRQVQKRVVMLVRVCLTFESHSHHQMETCSLSLVGVS